MYVFPRGVKGGGFVLCDIAEVDCGYMWRQRFFCLTNALFYGNLGKTVFC